MQIQGQLIETRKAVLTAILPALAVALLLLPRWSARCTFREVAPGVLRCRQSAAPLGPGAGFESTLLRVEETKGLIFKNKQLHHILVEGGAPNTVWGNFASGLVDGVERALRPKGRRGAKEPAPKLDLVILTHGHLTGALPQLLAKYPDCPVLLHSEEAPFLLGNFTAPYYDPRSAPLKVRFHLWTGLLPSKAEPGVPPERAALIQGEAGDVANALRSSKLTKKSMRWLPRGLLRYVHVPGHTPGSIALLHQPSKLLLAGDAVVPRKSWFGGAPSLAVAGAGIATDPAAGLASAKRLLLQEDYTLLFPTHCAGARCSFDKQTAVAVAEAWPEEASHEDMQVDVETVDRHIL